ncbi:MAG: peptidase M20, partial [Chloroflexota bacterium]
AGRIPRSAPLVTWAEQALKYSGSPNVLYVSGSTDANIPLSMGIPSVCVGLAISANSHRLDEYVETTKLPAGLKQLLLLVLAAGEYDGVI